MWGWWQTGDNLATLCGEKERQRSDAAFFLPFFPKKKNLGPTGFDPRSKQPGDRKPNTLTTTPNFPAVTDGSEDAYIRENQVVLFLPLDGSAIGPFRWTIPLRLIVQWAVKRTVYVHVLKRNAWKQVLSLLWFTVHHVKISVLMAGNYPAVHYPAD